MTRPRDRWRTRGLLVCLATLHLPAASAAQELADVGRPDDGLLENPALQALVDAQVERDAKPLTGALADPDPVVRARAAFALGSVQDRAAVPDLVRVLTDPDPRVRADAAFALGQSADSTAQESLLDALASETDPMVRRELLDALGKIGGRRSLNRLTALRVAPEEAGVLAQAIGRLGIRGIHDREAVQRLTEWLPREMSQALDPSEGIGTASRAAWYFGRERDTTAWAFAAGDVRLALDASFLAQSVPTTDLPGPGTGEQGMGASAGTPPELRLLPAIGRLGHPSDDERLVDWLESAKDWRARVEAARALTGRAGREVVGEALLAALGDPSVHVSLEAARAFSAADSLPLETQRVLAQRFMIGMLPWQVSAALAPAIVKGGGVGVVLLKLTGIAGPAATENPAYRADLLESLGLDDGEPSWRMLRFEAASEDPRVAVPAIAGLAERWRRGFRSQRATVDEYYRLFAAALERKDLGTATEAAPVLADSAFRPLGAVALLTRVYREMETPRDIEPMIEIVRALGETGDPAAEPVLREALDSTHPVLRGAAAGALGALLGRSIDIPNGPMAPDRRIDWSFLRRLGPHPRLVLETEMGRIVTALDAEEAPLTTQTILRLAEEGRYNGVSIHRVVPDFVIQGGDFERGDGYGGPGFVIRSEFTSIPFERGVIGMASAGKDTEGSQFFVTHSAQPHLDGRYTAFGRIVEGMAVVDRIVEGDRVERASLEPDPSGVSASSD